MIEFDMNGMNALEVAGFQRNLERHLQNAAFDLLEALQRFQDNSIDFGMPNDHPCRVQARAAIAKALGEPEPEEEE